MVISKSLGYHRNYQGGFYHNCPNSNVLKSNWNMYTLEESKFVSALHRYKLAAFNLLVHQAAQKQCCSLECIGQKSGFENYFW